MKIDLSKMLGNPVKRREVPSVESDEKTQWMDAFGFAVYPCSGPSGRVWWQRPHGTRGIPFQKKEVKERYPFNVENYLDAEGLAAIIDMTGSEIVFEVEDETEV
jgi:hypothetical protein